MDNHTIIENYFAQEDILFDKDVTIEGITFDYFIPRSKFGIIIRVGDGHKITYKKARQIASKTDKIKKVIGFNPRLKNDLNKAFEGCSSQYIKTGNKKISAPEIKTENLSEWDYQFAKEATENPTEEEVMVMRLLEHHNIPYVFQKPIIVNGHHYRPDFILFKNIVLEIDGGYHNASSQIKKDCDREKQLKSVGFQVIRATNEDIRDMYSKIS